MRSNMESMGYLFLAILACALSFGFGEEEKRTPDLTVTDEAWFEIEIKDYDGPGEDYRGRIVIGLFGKEVPITTLNFIKLTKGYEAKRPGGRTEKLGYKGTIFHRIVPDFIIQGGDVTVGDGTGGKSIYGGQFDDENFSISHKAAGYVSMANHGSNTNGSQFIILLSRARWLDSKHVVFGKIVEGMEVLKDMGEIPTNRDTKPKKKIKIINCGVDEVKKQYKLSEKEAASDEDISRN